LAVQKAAEYVRTLAEAVEFAHSKGVLHRDLKPANVLLDAFDAPRLTDFGLARILADTSELTVSGQALGSPAYMPPEQASGQQSKIGVRSDVYSLGAILYHALTGRPPFQGETVPQILRQVQEDEPIWPKHLNPAISDDLQTICLKSLEKDPARRYATAGELAADLARSLRFEPIQAKPPSPAVRAWFWCRRRPAVAILSGSVFLLLLILALGSSAAVWRVTSARRAEHQQRQNAEKANLELRQANSRLARTVSLLELRRAENLFREDDAAMGVAHLASVLRRDPADPIAATRLVSALVHRDWALRAAPPIRGVNKIHFVSFSPDGRQVLTSAGDGEAQVVDSRTSGLVFRLKHQGGILHAEYSHDGGHIVTAGTDGFAQIWNATDGASFAGPLRHNERIYWAEFSHDDRWLLTTSGDGASKIWNTSSGDLQQSLPEQQSPVLQGHFSPDGKSIATMTEAGAVRLWNLASPGPPTVLKDDPVRVNALMFSPDGSRLAAACDNAIGLVWNLESKETAPIHLGHSSWSQVWRIAFSPDSRFVLTMAEDGVARVWDSQTGFPVCEPLRHEGGVVFGDFSPGGDLVVTTSADVSARLWLWRASKPFAQPLRHTEPVRYAAFSPEGERLVTGSDDSTVQVWDVHTRRARSPQFVLGGAATSVAFTPDGTRLFTTSLNAEARLWNANGSAKVMRHASPVLCGALSSDGGFAATGCTNGAALVWDLATLQIIAGPVWHSNAVLSVRFSPRADSFVSSSEDGTARVWETKTGRPRTPPLAHGGRVLMAKFSPDGRAVVTVSEDRSARVWNADDGTPLTEPLQHRDHVLWADFSADRRRLVTASTDNTARIWDVATGKLAVPVLQHARIVGMAAFSPDNSRVATVSQDRAARVWDANTGQALTPPMLHDSAASHVSFSPDGRRIVTAGWNGAVRVWDAETGQPLTEWLMAPSKITDLCFDSTGERIAAGTESGVLCTWKVPPAPLPMPDWFARFAEGVAGVRVSDRGHVEAVSPVPGVETGTATNGPPTDFYQRLQAWFLADPARRADGPL
jgi:WD40 repeat protein